jgi:hypothetical protein
MNISIHKLRTVLTEVLDDHTSLSEEECDEFADDYIAALLEEDDGEEEETEE